MRFIDAEALKRLGTEMQNDYGRYLLDVARGAHG